MEQLDEGGKSEHVPGIFCWHVKLNKEHGPV